MDNPFSFKVLLLPLLWWIFGRGLQHWTEMCEQKILWERRSVQVSSILLFKEKFNSHQYSRESDDEREKKPFSIPKLPFFTIYFPPLFNFFFKLFFQRQYRHVGDLNVKCLCPYAYRGNKCETHEFSNDHHGKFEMTLSSRLCYIFIYFICKFYSCSPIDFFFFFLLSFSPLSRSPECNLSKDSTTTDDSLDYASCSSKCLNDLGSAELCSCHQNNEIGKRKSLRNSCHALNLLLFARANSQIDVTIV